MEENIVENSVQNNKNSENNNNSLVKKKEGIKNELTIFTVNMLNLYSQNERSGNPDEDITMHKIKTRHLLIYYLYRVFCKYRDTIMNVISVEDINNLYKLLNIPENSKGCMPMAGRMSNKKEQLDTALFTLIKVLNDFNMGHKRMVAEDKFKEMMEFFKSKENPKKILEDIKVLNILIPNLSTTNIEYNVFDKSDKKGALLDLGIEPYNDDVSLGSSLEATPMNSNTLLDNTRLNNTESNNNNNNKLEKELENADQKEFDASKVAIQNSSLPPQNKLPEVASLGDINKDFPNLPPTSPSPSESPPPTSPSPPPSESPPPTTPSPPTSPSPPPSESPPPTTPSPPTSPSPPPSESPPPALPGNELNNNNLLLNSEGSAKNELNKL